MVKDLKRHPGFKSYIILNNDGIVIKWDQIDEPMPYAKAVQHAHLMLDLCAKSKKYVRELFDGGDNEVENIRLRTDCFELIAAQHGKFTLIVIQEDEMEATRRAEELAKVAELIAE